MKLFKLSGSNSYSNDSKHIFQLIKLQDFTLKDRETAPGDGRGEVVGVSVRGMHGRKEWDEEDQRWTRLCNKDTTGRQIEEAEAE